MDALPALPPRDPDGHKGTFGTAAVIGGCGGGRVRMIGAPALAARAALRAGCGLARLYAPEGVLLGVLGLAPEATGRGIATDAQGHPEAAALIAALEEAVVEAQSVVIGPGMGPSAGLSRAVEHAQGLDRRAAPIVLDADAINMLAELGRPRARGFACRAVLTPHVGEFRRLQRMLGQARDPEREAIGAAKEAAAALGCVMVLKGHRTVVTDGARVFVNTQGNAALATAGSGDVLAGVIGGLLAQFAGRGSAGAQPGVDVIELAVLGVVAHARAGDSWRGSRGADGGLLATELLDWIPPAVQGLRAKGRG